MQTRKQSLIEALTNIVVGIVIALPAQFIYFYWSGIEASLSDNLGLAIWMTFISLARSYTLRRIYNNKLMRDLKNDRPN